MPSTGRDKRDYNYELTLHGHTAPITAAGLLPDGRIITASADSTLIVWRGMSKADYDRTSHGIEEEIKRSVPTGDKISFWENVAEVQERLRQHMTLAELKGHERDISCMKILVDGRVVSASEDGTLRVWTERQGERAWNSVVLRGHAAGILHMCALDEHLIVSGARDGSMCLWAEEHPNQWVCASLPGHSAEIKALDRFPNGKVLSGALDGTIRIWSPSGTSSSESLIKTDKGLCALEACSDAAFLAIGGQSVTMWRLDPETGIWNGTPLQGLRRAQALSNGDVIGFTHEAGIAVWRNNDQGGWHKIFSRDDWRDVGHLTPLTPNRVLLRTGWMDEGTWRRDVDILRVNPDGTLSGEVSFPVKYGDPDQRDIALPDGRFGMTRRNGSLDIYQGKWV